MKHVHIIGNSHVGALRSGWDMLAPEWGDRFKVSFFAAPAKVFAQLEHDPPFFGVRPGRGTPPRFIEVVEQINGMNRINLGEADLVLLVGRRYGRDELASVLADFSIAGIGHGTGRKPLSEAAFRAWVKDRVKDTDTIADWIRRLGARLILVPSPRPSEAVRELLDSAANKEQWARQDIDDAVIGPGLDLLEAEAAAVLETAGVRLLRHPKETLAPIGLTARHFARNSRRLVDEGLHDDEDLHHMNGEWGKMCLTAWLPQLSEI